MQEIKSNLLQQPKSYQNIMMWAACCIAFFSFQHVSEFTIPSQTAYDSTAHLSLHDIAMDSRQSPQFLQIRIKQSKTDLEQQFSLERQAEIFTPLRQGCHIWQSEEQNLDHFSL